LIEISRNEGGNEVFTAEFQVAVPTQTKDTATESDIEAAITEELANNPEQGGVAFLPVVEVKDKTKACLELCLGCQNPQGCTGPPPTIPPNKCCGTCSNPKHEGGKPYSTVTHACCQDQFVYDPETHSCCNSGVESQSSVPLFMKVKVNTCPSTEGLL